MSATGALSTPWQLLPADLVGALGARLGPTVDAVARNVSEAVPAFAAIEDPKFQRDVHAAVQVAVERFIELIGTDQPALPAKVREAFVALGAAEAREDRAPDVLLAALRTASRGLLRAASLALTGVRAPRPEELLDLADAVTAYVDELVAASTDGYALQLREQAGETDRRRRVLGELLLRGTAAEAVVAGAAADVGWARLGTVVPVLLPSEHARDARFRYGGDGIVVDRERDSVLLVQEGRRSGRTQLSEALHGRSAVVGPQLDWRRVPEGVRLAELTAKLVGENPGHAGAPVFADDHLAQLALQGEAGALEVLSARRLAPFEGLGDGVRDRLLATLHSWLRHWGSRAEVADELFIHPQTVSYRMRRLRELLGADLDDPTARFELLLVLAGPVGTRRLRRPA
ncbi:PucR family transcriptional regulator [Nocardioides dilutus]